MIFFKPNCARVCCVVCERVYVCARACVRLCVWWCVCVCKSSLHTTHTNTNTHLRARAWEHTRSINLNSLTQYREREKEQSYTWIGSKRRSSWVSFLQRSVGRVGFSFLQIQFTVLEIIWLIIASRIWSGQDILLTPGQVILLTTGQVILLITVQVQFSVGRVWSGQEKYTHPQLCESEREQKIKKNWFGK